MKKALPFLPREKFDELITALQTQGYEVIGPRLEEGVISYKTLSCAEDLPRGIRDTQQAGYYRSEQTDSPRYFAWANGAQALKLLTFVPQETLWQVERNDQGELNFQAHSPQPKPKAVIGVRACDLAALKLQEQHFQERGDTWFHQRREALLIIAVHCTHPAETCFCASTGDGPKCQGGFDLALSELDEGFLVEAGSKAGERVLSVLNLAPAQEEHTQTVVQESYAAVEQQRKHLPPPKVLYGLRDKHQHAHWDDVAKRCLSCGNCTAVCPSCFCFREQEQPALDQQSSEHTREWDSCFTQGHSYIHGIVLRQDTRSRYRQWLTHKLAGWQDQYGRIGCTGCGRCITWCPAGIDITEEAHALCDD